MQNASFNSCLFLYFFLSQTEYDHEAFLGEEAKTFDDLSPEESKQRLAIIVDKIDKDKNGFVTQQELQDWIKFTQRRYIYEVRYVVIYLVWE